MPLFLVPYAEQQFDIRASDGIRSFYVVPSRSFHSSSRFSSRSSVSSCGSFCYVASRPSSRPVVLLFISFVSPCRLAPPSRHAVSSYIRAALVVSLLSSREAGRPLRLVLSNRPRSCVAPVLRRLALSSRFAMRRNGTVLRFFSCRRVFHVVSFHPFVVGVGVSLRGVCWEIELTKTAHFAITVVSVSSGSCSSCRGDVNRARSNGSETRDRCRLVRTPGLSYARRSFPPIDFLARSSPDLGAGEHLRPAGKREPARGGRAKDEEKKRACFPYSFSHSLCLFFSRSRLVIVAVCGIPCRLVSRLVMPSRSVVSFPVCLFRFRPWASRFVVSFSLFVIASRPFCSLTHSVRPVSVSSLIPVRRCCHSYLAPAVSAVVFILVIPLSPSCVSCSLALPIAFPRCPI